MLKIKDSKAIFFTVSLLGALLIASPFLVYALPSWTVEGISELYILGPNHMDKDYPFNVKANETYKVFSGIGNHLGSSAYYAMYVKLRNLSEPLPNSTTGMPSPLPTSFEYRAFLSDGEVWETPLVFSFRNVSYSEARCFVGKLTINGLTQYVNKTIPWNSENHGFFLKFFFELWIYNPENETFGFHNRFVYLLLNVTA
jgi:hypothetical protein